MSDIETEAILFGRRPTPRDRGLFFIRLALAIVFIAHGWDKFTHLEATIDSFAAVGLPLKDLAEVLKKFDVNVLSYA